MPRMLPVLLGGDANVYGMARSFYECYGVRSLAVCRRALPALAHSRLVRVAVQDPAFGQDHVFTATLLGLAAQYPGVPKILISCADDYTALLARHADALRGAYRFACPPPAALHLADKRQFAAACRAAGLRTPQTVTLCPADALPPLPFGWPVIAKPADQAAYARCDFPGRRKVYLVRDAARLRELLAAAARGGYFGSWLARSTSPARTRGSGSSTPTARRTAVCRGLCRASPFCRSARPRAPATMPPCWWSRPGRTRRCWMPCAAFCRRRAGTALPILI